MPLLYSVSRQHLIGRDLYQPEIQILQTRACMTHAHTQSCPLNKSTRRTRARYNFTEGNSLLTLCWSRDRDTSLVASHPFCSIPCLLYNSTRANAITWNRFLDETTVCPPVRHFGWLRRVILLPPLRGINQEKWPAVTLLWRGTPSWALAACFCSVKRSLSPSSFTNIVKNRWEGDSEWTELKLP